MGGGGDESFPEERGNAFLNWIRNIRVTLKGFLFGAEVSIWVKLGNTRYLANEENNHHLELNKPSGRTAVSGKRRKQP